MSKAGFDLILERQRKSGLTIKEFCMNEAYSLTNFYFWKRKFCTSGHSRSPEGVKGSTGDFAPVRLPVSERPFTTPDKEDLSGGLHEILMELPGGIKIHFRGVGECEVAIRLINQMYSGHV